MGRFAKNHKKEGRLWGRFGYDARMTTTNSSAHASAAGLHKLLEVMARLRDPQHGCPWDLEQDFKSIAKYTIEETYEVVDAIEREDFAALKEELGDLLLQIVFYAQMADEKKYFNFHDIAEAIADKMVARHPHVFGDAAASTAGDVIAIWENKKAEEREKNADKSALAGVIGALPALPRAVKLQQRAARVGFDWTTVAQIMPKLHEEVAELEAALRAPDHNNHVEEELGDILFVMANIARRLDIDPEGALRQANAKFEERFRGMEALARQQGKEMKNCTLDEQEAFWQQVKAQKKSVAVA